MVKSILGVNHQGLRDWIIQRITAVILALATLGLASFFIANPQFSYLDWRMLFAATGIKVLTLLVVLSLAFHAWVGIWTVITDYVKPAMLRFFVNIFVLLTLVSCVLWALLIVWGF